MNRPVIRLVNVSKHFVVKKNWSQPEIVRAVDGVCLDIPKGETLGLVGESGCGKSTLASLILRLEQPDTGQIWWNQTEVSQLPEALLRPLRSRIQIVFQDPYSSLNPRMTVAKLITEPMAVQGLGTPVTRKEKALSLLEKVGLTGDALTRYPHEFSGGQRQRLSLARALTTNPEVLILDEPTSALDVSVQAQVLNLLLELQTELKLTYLFISHNLAIVRYMADQTAVMYQGKLVETGPTATVMTNPAHPYTQNLVAAVPVI